MEVFHSVALTSGIFANAVYIRRDFRSRFRYGVFSDADNMIDAGRFPACHR
jgi:hypothetical protein